MRIHIGRIRKWYGTMMYNQRSGPYGLTYSIIFDEWARLGPGLFEYLGDDLIFYKP